MHTRLVILLIFAALFPALSASAKEIYRTVDEDGNVVFSDSPSTSSSEKVTLPPTNIQPATKTTVKEQQPNTPETEDDRAPISYSLSIVSPSPDQQVGPAQKSITIVSAVRPALRGEHLIQFYIDGKPQGIPQNFPSITVDLPLQMRGRRSVSAAVVSASGAVIRRSNSVTFYVIRPRKR